MFWGIFAATQLVGALGLAIGNPLTNPFAFLLGVVFSFPGSLLCWFLYRQVATPVGQVILTCFFVNLVCWHALALAIARVRRRQAA